MMHGKRWGIQQRVMVYLFLAVVLSSTVVALAVAWLANRELKDSAEQQIAVLHSHLRDRFHAFDLLLAEQEKTLDARLNETLPATARALMQRAGDPAAAPSSLLDELCRRHGFDHLYVINRKGVVVNTNLAADRGLDLAGTGASTRAMLDRLYGSGRVFSDRFNVSVKTGILRKYAYFSPPGADYIIEASFNLRDYVRRTAGPVMERYIFEDLFSMPTAENSRIRDLDIFLANDYASWSLADRDEQLPDDVRRAFVSGRAGRLRRQRDDELIVYESYPRLGGSAGQNAELITEVAYDLGAMYRLLHRTLWLAAGLAVGLGFLSFVLAVPFFNRWLVRPVERIAGGLEAVSMGRFRPQKITGVPELDVITRGVNAMQADIEQRERALLRANENLEARVQERTAELETLNEELERQASTDLLTGLASRRVFFELGPVEVARMQRQGTPLTVALMDIDHFKSVNDSHGHEEGDRALRTVGGILKSELRQTDIAARLGGEEFGIILTATDPDAALEVLERIRRRIGETAVTAADGQEISLTVSIGSAGCTDDDDIVSALRKADRALYNAKDSGRNRVEVYA